MVWDSSSECRSRKELGEIQLQRLQELVTRLYIRVPFYRAKFDQAGIKPQDILTLEDIARIPFTTKHELRETYPYGLVAVDESEIVEVHTSSGTTGTPVVGAYTRRDIETWSHSMARTLAMAGAGSRGHSTERVRLRPVHRRIGSSLRSPDAWSQRNPDFRREYSTAADDYAGFRHDPPYLYALIFTLPGRGRDRGKDRSPVPPLARRLFRGRTLE